MNLFNEKQLTFPEVPAGYIHRLGLGGMHMPKPAAGRGNRIVPIGFLKRLYPES